MLRLLACGALTATAIFAGPQALAAARARYEALTARAPSGPRVDLDRVGFAQAPAWLEGSLLRHVATDLTGVLTGDVGLHDGPGADRLLAGLRALPWVREVALERVYPDRLRASIELRHPIARLQTDAGACLLDAAGVCLPDARGVRVPAILAGRISGPESGRPLSDAAVRAAVAVVAEWRDEIAPAVPGVPELLAVDATNYGYARLAEGRWCEVRVGLARAGGGIAWLDYDHPPGSAAPRIPSATKADVLRRILALHPGLAQVERADLRFPRRFERWIVCSGSADPEVGSTPR